MAHKLNKHFTKEDIDGKCTQEKIFNIISHSVQFSCSVVSDSLRPQGPQHARPPCPSLTPRAYSNSYPPSRWCHPTISSSVVPFSSRLPSFLASGSFPVTQFFTLVAKVLEIQLQHQSFQWIFKTDLLWDGLVWPQVTIWLFISRNLKKRQVSMWELSGTWRSSRSMPSFPHSAC